MTKTRVPRIENIAQQRLKAFNRINKETVSQDPIVKEHREKIEREKREREEMTASEVTQQIISAMTRDKVAKKGKKSTSNYSLSNKTPEELMNEHAQSSVSQAAPVERPKVYNLRNKKTVANNIGMKISLFDKSFERDQL
jgi:hypothetical protein